MELPLGLLYFFVDWDCFLPASFDYALDLLKAEVGSIAKTLHIEHTHPLWRNIHMWPGLECSRWRLTHYRQWFIFLSLVSATLEDMVLEGPVPSRTSVSRSSMLAAAFICLGDLNTTRLKCVVLESLSIFWQNCPNLGTPSHVGLYVS